MNGAKPCKIMANTSVIGVATTVDAYAMEIDKNIDDAASPALAHG